VPEPSPFPPTRLVLVASAAYTKHDPPRLADHHDLGLSDEGRAQVRSLLRRLAATGELADATTLVAGNARRARETAELLAPAIGDGTLALRASCDYCNPHSGECEDMAARDWLQTLAVDRLANWSPYAPKSPGGESMRVAIERLSRALVDLVLATRGGTAVVVSHDFAVRASLWNFLSLPFFTSYTFPRVTKTGITEWIATGWLAGSGEMKAELVRVNDHAHLLRGAWE
jgi:broad specificity phosphatase PhoE